MNLSKNSQLTIQNSNNKTITAIVAKSALADGLGGEGEEEKTYEDVHVLVGIEGVGVDVVGRGVFGGGGVGGVGGHGRFWRVETRQQISHPLRFVVQWHFICTHFLVFFFVCLFVSLFFLFLLRSAGRCSHRFGGTGMPVTKGNELNETFPKKLLSHLVFFFFF